MARVLIAYATKMGSTAEIAQALAKELNAAGHAADAVEINELSSPAGYDAIVIGGPMYMGHMDGRVAKFVKRHSADLAKVPVAGFAVGLAAASKDAEGIAWTEKALHAALDEVGEVGAEGFGVDAMGPAHAGGVLVLQREDLQRLNEAVQAAKDNLP